MSAVARWGTAVAGVGFAAVGVSIALWSMPAPGDAQTVVALAALRLLAVVVAVGLAVVAVLARPRAAVPVVSGPEPDDGADHGDVLLHGEVLPAGGAG